MFELTDYETREQEYLDEQWARSDYYAEAHAAERYTCPVCGRTAYGDYPCDPADHATEDLPGDEPENFGAGLLPNTALWFTPVVDSTERCPF